MGTLLVDLPGQPSIQLTIRWAHGSPSWLPPARDWGMPTEQAQEYELTGRPTGTGVAQTDLTGVCTNTNQDAGLLRVFQWPGGNEAAQFSLNGLQQAAQLRQASAQHLGDPRWDPQLHIDSQGPILRSVST